MAKHKKQQAFTIRLVHYPTQHHEAVCVMAWDYESAVLQALRLHDEDWGVA